VRVFFHPITRR